MTREEFDLIVAREKWCRENRCEEALSVYDDRRALLAHVDCLTGLLREAGALLDEAEQWLGDNDDEESTARRIRAFLRRIEEVTRE